MFSKLKNYPWEMMELWNLRRLGTDAIASRPGCKQGEACFNRFFVSPKTKSQRIYCEHHYSSCIKPTPIGDPETTQTKIQKKTWLVPFLSHFVHKKAGPLISNQKSQNLLMTALDMGEAIVESTEVGFTRWFLALQLDVFGFEGSLFERFDMAR